MQRFFTKKNTIITVIAVVVVTAIVYRLVRGTWFGGIMEGAVRARIMGSGGTGQYAATPPGPMERKQAGGIARSRDVTWISEAEHEAVTGQFGRRSFWKPEDVATTDATLP